MFGVLFDDSMLGFSMRIDEFTNGAVDASVGDVAIEDSNFT